MSLIRQSAEFFRRDYKTAWVGTGILSAPLFLANLFGATRPVLDSLLPDMAIWVLLVALVTFAYATLLIRIARYLAWIIRLWGRAKKEKKDYRVKLSEPFDEILYAEVAAGILDSWRKDVQKMRDDVRFR
jgi:hypothetical protein